MNVQIYEPNPNNTYKVVLLIKEKDMDMEAIHHEYITELNALGLAPHDIALVGLPYDENNKAGVKVIRAFLEDELVPLLKMIKAEFILVADSPYFKELSGQSKVTGHTGYLLSTNIRYPDLAGMKITKSVNFRGLLHNPGAADTITKANQTIISGLDGTYAPPGNVITEAHFPSDMATIQQFLNGLLIRPVLTCDIEAFSLRVDKSRIGTIGFAWSKTAGGAFKVDNYWFDSEQEFPNQAGMYAMLLDFFLKYKGKLIFHNANYDVKVLIYWLFMKGKSSDWKGLSVGLKTLFRDIEDTKVLVYLCTNNAQRNQLDLKSNAHDYMGNYAQEDIHDITLIPVNDLLMYNLEDCVATFELYERYTVKLVEEKQDHLYQDLFMKSVKSTVEMELVGFCLDMSRVKELTSELAGIAAICETVIAQLPIVQSFIITRTKRACLLKNLALKKKVILYKDFPKVIFNTNSPKQLADLLHNELELPITKTTPTGEPQTSKSVLSAHLMKLISDNKLTRTDEDNPKTIIGPRRNVELLTAQIHVLESMITLSEVNIIINNFLLKFVELAVPCPDGTIRLRGSFNVCGTGSGRNSSSEPNLMNLPSGSTYGKAVKTCFIAPPGYLMVGVDYAALEDYASALVTSDPEKLKVYLDGYDSHSLRAINYFPTEVPLISDKLALVDKPGKFYKVVDDAGDVHYYHESKLPKELSIGTQTNPV